MRRDSERSPDELSRNRKTVLGIGGAVLLVAVAMGNLHPFGRHVSVFPGGFHIDTGSHEPKEPVTIGAAQLFEAYHTDSHAAGRQFGNREMVVTGEFVRTVPDGYGSIDMRLKTGHPDFLLGIDLDRHSVDAATKLEPGESVTVSCRRVAGFGDDPWLQDCVLQPPPGHRLRPHPRAPLLLPLRLCRRPRADLLAPKARPPCGMRPFGRGARFAVEQLPECPGESKEEHMTHLTTLIAGAALAGIDAVPAAAQYYPQQTYPQSYPYQQTYPQQYPQQYPQTYQGYQQPYGYGQNYGQNYGQGYTGNPVTDIIDQLLGNRYSVTDRQAVRRCAHAAMAQAGQYGGGYGNGYNRSYGSARVTSITNVERRSNGLRVSGLMSAGGYGNQGYGYGGQGYGGQSYGGAQLSFRCNVDYSGAVTGLRVRPIGGY